MVLTPASLWIPVSGSWDAEVQHHYTKQPHKPSKPVSKEDWVLIQLDQPDQNKLSCAYEGPTVRVNCQLM